MQTSIIRCQRFNSLIRAPYHTQFLCADPVQVPRLAEWLLKKVQRFDGQAESAVQHSTISGSDDLAPAMPWLFASEIAALESEITNLVNQNSSPGIHFLSAAIVQTMKMTIEVMEEGNATDVPLGLQNRWRIWRILESAVANSVGS